MLKAAIIYIPGTGGSFLRRVLSLAKNAVVDSAHDFFTIEQKLTFFNNWNSKDWKATERLYRPAYRWGTQEFSEFETSKLYLIDAWHPTEFYDHDQNKICWHKGAWPWLIFLNVGENYRNFIEDNRHTKKYALDWDVEQKNFSLLKQQYQDRAIELNFDDLCDCEQFESAVQKINQKLNLDLDMSLVSTMWNNWYEKSKAIWIK